MATTKSEAEKAGAEAVKETDTSSGDRTFTVERAIAAGPALVNQPPHVVAGALASVSKKEVTVDELQAACDKWLKAEVKTGDSE